MASREESRNKLIEILKAIDDRIMYEIPAEATDGLIQIALSTKDRKVPLLLSEEDFLDLLDNPSKLKEIRDRVEQLIHDLNS